MSLGSLVVRVSYRVLQAFLYVFPVVGHGGEKSLWAWIRTHDHVHGGQVFLACTGVGGEGRESS